MKDRKIRMNNSMETKAVSKDICERLELDPDLKLQTLANIFSATKDHLGEFHQLYVQPLLESGLNLEDSLAMLVINRLSESPIERARVLTVTHTSSYRTSESSPALGESKWV